MSLSRHTVLFSAPFSLTKEVVADSSEVSPARIYTAAELEAEYQRGRLDGAREADQGVDRRFVEFRAEISSVISGLFERLAAADTLVSEQLRSCLPDLTVEVARRVLHGHTPSPDEVERICAHALAAVFPEVSDLEVVVGERDHEIVQRLLPGWSASYPGIKVSVNAGFSPGECQVRSRFGTIDAKHESKLRVLRREIEVA